MAANEGKPLTRYCPLRAGHACVVNCEWHDGDGCVIWQVLKALNMLASDIERIQGELRK